MLLEKTFLQFDILSLEIVFDQGTADTLKEIVAGSAYSKSIEARVVNAALQASNANARIQFLFEISFDQFVDGGRANARRALESGLIGQDEYSRVYHGLPHWFSFLKSGEIEEGDQMFYRGRPDGLESVYVDHKGRTRMAVSHSGSGPMRTMLASYFAPGSDFREPLVRSLFQRR